MLENSDMSTQEEIQNVTLAGFQGEDYLSDEEREEALELMREIFGVTVKDGYVHSQGRSWQLPEN